MRKVTCKANPSTTKHKVNVRETNPPPISQSRQNEPTPISNDLIQGTRSTRKAICYCESDDSPEKKSKEKDNNEEEKIELSEYELIRERRINERLKLFKKLNIEEAKSSALKAASQYKKKKIL